MIGPDIILTPVEKALHLFKMKRLCFRIKDYNISSANDQTNLTPQYSQIPAAPIVVFAPHFGQTTCDPTAGLGAA